VPSGMASLVVGEPVSTPAGIWFVCDVFGLRRGGCFAGLVCAWTGRSTKANEAAAMTTRQAAMTQSFTRRSPGMLPRQSDAWLTVPASDGTA